MGGKCDNKKRVSNSAHPLPRVLGYRRERLTLWRVILHRVECITTLYIFLDKSLVQYHLLTYPVHCFLNINISIQFFFYNFFPST